MLVLGPLEEDGGDIVCESRDEKLVSGEEALMSRRGGKDEALMKSDANGA